MAIYEITGRTHDVDEASTPADTKHSRRRFYHITGKANVEEARQELVSNAPQVSGGLPAYAYRLNELGYEFYEGEIEYKTLNLSIQGGSNLGVSQFSVRVSASTASQHITHGELISSTASSHPPGKLATSFFGAIAVDLEEPDKPSVQGIDILVPVLSMTITVGKLPATLTSNFWKNIGRMTAKINGDPFMGFAPGEVLFVGASGEVTEENRILGDSSVPIAYEFQMQENLRNIQVGKEPAGAGAAQVTVPEKLGWDVLSVTTVPWIDTGNLQSYPGVVCADVVRVYEFSPIRFESIF